MVETIFRNASQQGTSALSHRQPLWSYERLGPMESEQSLVTTRYPISNNTFFYLTSFLYPCLKWIANGARMNEKLLRQKRIVNMHITKRKYSDEGFYNESSVK